MTSQLTHKNNKYMEYQSKICVELIYVYLCAIFIYGLKYWSFELQGVPKNMGIQWRIQYRLFKYFFDLV